MTPSGLVHPRPLAKVSLVGVERASAGAPASWLPFPVGTGRALPQRKSWLPWGAADRAPDQ